MHKLLLSTLGFWLAGVCLAAAQDSAAEQQLSRIDQRHQICQREAQHLARLFQKSPAQLVALVRGALHRRGADLFQVSADQVEQLLANGRQLARRARRGRSDAQVVPRPGR